MATLSSGGREYFIVRLQSSRHASSRFDGPRRIVRSRQEPVIRRQGPDCRPAVPNIPIKLMSSILRVADYIGSFASSPFALLGDVDPWELTSRSAVIVQQQIASLAGEDFIVEGEIARHKSATVEQGAVLKGPLVLGARCFVGSGAYLRGGCWLGEDCIVGPGSELKSSFVFARTKLAHFNFVGDSVVGSDVNMEAGSVVCNYRNERPEHEIRIRLRGALLQLTGVEKFGALIGDGTRLGANSVVAPGALLLPATIVGRASLLDQESGS